MVVPYGVVQVWENITVYGIVSCEVFTVRCAAGPCGPRGGPVGKDCVEGLRLFI